MSTCKERTTYHEEFKLPSFDDNIFLVWGYGSILWKQNFEFDAEYETYIKGYKRVFYQGSKDHRGTAEKPGRVVTLLPEEDKEARVYGKAYQLPTSPEKLRDIFSALDTREQGGYERLVVTLYDSHPSEGGKKEHAFDLREKGVDTQGKNVICLCYNGTTENEDYMGPAETEAMARQILACTGPSGPNREYLFFLADNLRAMGVVDPHVFEIEAAAKRILANEEGVDNTDEKA